MVLIFINLFFSGSLKAYWRQSPASPDLAQRLLEEELRQKKGLSWHLICEDLSLGRCVLVSETGGFTPLATVNLRYPAVRGLRQSYLESNIRYFLADKFQILLELRKDQRKLEEARRRTQKILKSLGKKGKLLADRLPGYISEAPMGLLGQERVALKKTEKKKNSQNEGYTVALRRPESVVIGPTLGLKESRRLGQAGKVINRASPKAHEDYGPEGDYGLLGRIFNFLVLIWGWVMENLLLVSVLFLLFALLLSMARRV
ncbi:hypothetical protein [Thermosulfuriphilus sp.]